MKRGDGLKSAGDIVADSHLKALAPAESRVVPPTPIESQQLTLFQNFLCNTNEQRQELSNAIDLWDSIPRYSISRAAQARKRQPRQYDEETDTAKGTTLKKITTTVHYMRCTYECTITPARVTDLDGNERDYYPSANEELVEDALRKLAADQAGFFDDSKRPTIISGVGFSLYGLQQELARVGHSRSCAELKLSLDIMQGSNVHIVGKDESGQEINIKSSYLPTVIAVSRGRLRDDPKARWLVHFHPLVTASIDKVAYRQFNYGKMMRQKKQLARWLHKQLALKCVGADLIRPFEMRFSTIKRDGGLLDRYSQTRDAVKALVDALEALKTSDVISAYDRKDVLGRRKKIEDVVFNLWPSLEFVRDVKASNKRQNDSLQKLDPRGTTRGFLPKSGGTTRGKL